LALIPLENFSTVWLPQGQWPDLLTFLCDRFPGIGRDRWVQRLRAGAVWDAHGHALALESPYRAGQHLHYLRAPENEPSVPFEAKVLFEDEMIVVADKPHFLPVTPGGDYLAQTLQSRLRKQLACPQLQVVHRLDRETAGLVLLVKDPAHRGPYQTLFEHRQVFKQYLAIAPLPPPDLVMPHRHASRLVASGQFFLQKEEVGVPNSETELFVSRELPNRRALFTLIPYTGKKHQLRVHMASIGCPIEGDRFYPVAKEPAPLNFTAPLQLLAQRLQFKDPFTQTHRSFQTQRQLDGVNSPSDPK
jgi:tRNA pseudouridine32 synthase/23S rRNA pseudouridine746 synthase